MNVRTLLSGAIVVGLLVLMSACVEEKETPSAGKEKSAAKTECKTCEVVKKPAAKPAEKPSTAGKKPAPTWDLDGEIAPEIETAAWFNTDKPLTLNQFRKKKFVMLVFWFTACPHCRKEVPRLQEIHSRFTGPLFQLITIVSDLKDNQQTVNKYIKKNSITRVINYYFSHHLSYNHFKVFVVNFHTLQPVNFLNFVYNIFLNFCRSFNSQYIRRSYSAVR